MEFRTNYCRIIGMMRTLLPFQVTVKPYALSTAPIFRQILSFHDANFRSTPRLGETSI